MSRGEFLRRATVAGLTLSAASSLLAACGSGGQQESQKQEPAGPVRRGGTARLGIIVPASDPDPVTLFSGGGQATTQVCAEALCFVRPDYSLAPMLATKWEPGAGAKEWTFTLREGVKFHDGSTMTADDVVATFDRLTDPDNESAALSAFQGILSYEQTEKIVPKDYEMGFQQEETPGIIAYWTKELRVVKDKVAGLAKGPNIVLDMSPVWTSG
jgi:peptide/nickel transport system substrate-binding protein